MATVIRNRPSAASRSARLKAATDDLHEHLHIVVANADPFTSRERFGLWLAAQHRFNGEIDHLYHLAALQPMILGLSERSRLQAVKADLADLGLPRPVAIDTAPPLTDRATALGWLFVAEGSTLGAAILLKRAGALGLSDTFGARHLAAAPAGRAWHWKQFVRVLDEVELSKAEEVRLEHAACDAFNRFEVVLRKAFDMPA